MKQSNKIWLGWFAFAFVVWHTVSIFIYAFPEEYTPAPLKRFVTPYVSPVFEQTWSLFAPCPLYEQHLRIRYYFENDTTGWISPMQHDLEQHRFWRASYHGELALGEFNALHFLRNDMLEMGLSVEEPFPLDSLSTLSTKSSYWILWRFIYGTSEKIFGEAPVMADVECSYKNVKSNRQNVFVLPGFKWMPEK